MKTENNKYDTLREEYVNFFFKLERGFHCCMFKNGKIEWHNVIKKKNFNLLNSEILFWVIGDQVQKYINELNVN